MTVMKTFGNIGYFSISITVGGCKRHSKCHLQPPLFITESNKLTLSLATPFVSDIRINFEKYFYREGAIVKPSEKDKIVVEFITRF